MFADFHTSGEIRLWQVLEVNGVIFGSAVYPKRTSLPGTLLVSPEYVEPIATRATIHLKG